MFYLLNYKIRHTLQDQN